MNGTLKSFIAEKQSDDDNYILTLEAIAKELNARELTSARVHLAIGLPLKRMGYDESKMKSMKYKMTVYNEFLNEYEYRKKHYGVKEDIQKKQRDRKR